MDRTDSAVDWKVARAPSGLLIVTDAASRYHLPSFFCNASLNENCRRERGEPRAMGLEPAIFGSTARAGQPALTDSPNTDFPRSLCSLLYLRGLLEGGK